MSTETTATTSAVEEALARYEPGSDELRDHLVTVVQERLLRLTRSMKRGYAHVSRWEQTEDICQNALMRLHRGLSAVEVQDARHFFRLAALQIRRELIEQARRVDGAHGLHKNHQTQHLSQDGDGRAPTAFEAFETTGDPAELNGWSEFHKAIGELPDEEREVVELLWYHGMAQNDAARLLKVADKTVQRRWLRARCRLGERLRGDGPLID